MHSIKRILMSVAFAAAAMFAVSGGSVVSSAFAGETQSVKADAEYKVADLGLNVRYSNNSRVCCERRGRDWWSTYRQCRRSGGHVTANRECRSNVGYQDQRVCCKRGGRDWWSTARQCRRSGGYATANRECRRD